MNGPDSISDPVARRNRYTGSYPSAPSRLGSTQLGSWLMTCLVGPTILTCQLTGRWHGMLTVHETSWWRHLYPGQSCGSGHLVFGSGLQFRQIRRMACVWRASVHVANNLAGAWRCVRTIPKSDFDAVFTSGFISSSSTQWYGQNTILTTFIFEQKSNTTLNHMLWYQLLGIPTPHAQTGGVLIVAQKKLSTLAHNI
jgi:hypothetical protein